MQDLFDPYRKWLGIRATERPLNHYQLLGLEPFEDDVETISHAVDQRMTYVRTLAVGEYIDATQKLLNELAAAKVCLLNPDKKVAYDERLRVDAPLTQIRPAPLPALAGRSPRPPPVFVPPPAAQPIRAWLTPTSASAVTTHAVRLRRRPTWFVPVAAFFASATLVPILAFLLFGGGNDSEPAPAVAPFSPEQAKRHQDAWASHLGARDTDLRSKWFNETYNVTVRSVREGDWAEIQNSTGQILWEEKEVVRTQEYVELFCPKRNYHIRLLKERMELLKDGRWGWVANGRWETVVSEANDANGSAPSLATNASSPAPPGDTDREGSSTNRPRPLPVDRHVGVPIDGTSKFRQVVELTAEGRPLEVGKRAVTRLVDWDADGNLDLLVGAGDGYVWIFRNVGSKTEFRLALGERVKDGQADLRAGTEYTTACFVDMTGDRKSDLIVADSVNRVRMFFNRGTTALPNFNGFTTIPDPNGNEFRLPPGCGGRIDVGDWDDDGRPDIVAGSYAGNISLFTNVGTAASPRFEATGVPLTCQGKPWAEPYNVHPTIFDLNRDGHPDVAYGINWGYVNFYISDPSYQRPSAFAFRDPAVRLGNLDLRAIAGDDTTPTFGDVNSDGVLDMISGGLKGKLWLLLGIPNVGWDPLVPTVKPARANE